MFSKEFQKDSEKREFATRIWDIPPVLTAVAPALLSMIGMTVSNEMMFRSMENSLLYTKQSVYDIQQQISSGKKVTKPSDDPAAYELISRLHTDLSHTLQYAKNADFAKNELITSENSLQQTLAMMQNAAELAVTGSDGTLSATDRQNIAKQVDQILQTLISTANASDSGKTVFGGLRTNAPAYTSADTNGDGYIDTVTYQGSDQVKKVEVGQGVFIDANSPGSNLNGPNGVFQSNGVDLFSTLIQLRDRLLKGENVSTGEATTADPVTDVLATQNVYTTGSTVEFSSTGTLPVGITAGTTYYAINVPGVGIRLATSLQNARNNAWVDIGTAGTGTLTVKQKTLQDINDCVDHMTNMLAANGSKQQAIQVNSNLLLQKEDAITSSLDKNESIDLATAMMELSKQQVAYDAALRSASTVMSQKSLMNYI